MQSQRVTMYRALASTSRIALLDVLRSGERMTITELSERVDLHPNTTREHLARLAEAGFVACEPEFRTTRGRPRILYRLTDIDNPLWPTIPSNIGPATTDEKPPTRIAGEHTAP